jgi:hypothetical protein
MPAIALVDDWQKNTNPQVGILIIGKSTKKSRADYGKVAKLGCAICI